MSSVNDTVWKPILELAQDVQTGRVKAIDLVERSLRKIEELNPTYNVVISVIKERSMQRAREIDELVTKGAKIGVLCGVPFLAKDNFLTFGAETTAASNMLKGFTAPYQATAIKKLEAAGAICVGKTNLDAFAHGGSTENSDFGVTKNPHDSTRVAGGSSGGSAAAVALGFTPFALGTDTGGSIRQPASYCGVVGLKPTYGLVSRSGVVAMSSSTDVIGPLTRSVADAALVLDVIAGMDDLDGTTIDCQDNDFSKFQPVKKAKVGIIKEYLSDGVDETVAAQVKIVIDRLKSSGHIVEEISLPTIPLALAVYYVVVPAELSSNLSRYDGQRYQYAASASTLEESYTKSRSNGFGREAKRRIIIGTHVLSSGYYDAYYKKAQTVRTKICNEFKAVFKEYDYLIGPVAPTPAFKIGEHSNDPLNMYLQDIMTVAANLAGLPAISIPTKHDGLPIGVQVIADQKHDKALLQFAKSIEEGL